MAGISIIDENWLRMHGVKGSTAQLKKLAQKAGDVLEMRVGNKITTLLSEEQLDEFEAMLAAGSDPDENLAWLEKVMPDYKKIVQAENAKLKRQITRQTDKAGWLTRLEP